MIEIGDADVDQQEEGEEKGEDTEGVSREEEDDENSDCDSILETPLTADTETFSVWYSDFNSDCRGLHSTDI